MRYDAEPTWIKKPIDEVWSLIRDARVREAREKSEDLVERLQDSIDEGGKQDRQLLKGLALACHLAGYTTSMSTRNYDALEAARYFEEMRRLATILEDDRLLVIALSYKGDAYRRKGDLDRAMEYLQSAYMHRPQLDEATLGNAAQLLARVYFLQGDLEKFEEKMAEAEEQAKRIDQEDNSLRGQYCLGTVYIDYARHYGKTGRTREALEYLQKAEEALPPNTIHWYTLLTATRGILLVRIGDIAKGMPYVMEALQLGQEHGNERLMDHLHVLKRFLNQKVMEMNAALVQLSDGLDGHELC
jgi:tetratricopeptide (TPR) repeat protein